MFMHHVACYLYCINTIPYKEEVFPSSDGLHAKLQSGANKKYYSPVLAKTHNSK